ncbi:family 20 glycosylhydrolase [Dyadobacter subterraneus]|uniref:beta-N-acetylhexosaminidase n=1 Tax=Dyadobacter subterraneus TaxID=2773304 RepID=A0ABR9W7T3_9BACT|nr:family 20 glycosylhydrolase [Dyadobacter subterraneus]MBE9461515.1 family 20 glycosylhydrolase [Dyadobacter subterraneus]
MKKSVTKTWILFLFSISAIAQNEPLLLPKPNFVQVKEGVFPLENLSVFVPKNASEDISFAVNELKSVVQERTGKYPKTASISSQATFQFKIKETGHQLAEVSEMDGNSEREWYQLSISSGKIQVEAHTSTGLYYAVQTLRQLAQGYGKNAAFSFITIKDKPKITYRGIMMDFAHGGLLTVDEIKKQIDFLAKFKTNQYYFYNEVSIELDGFPSLGYKTGYSKKDIVEIIAYGKQRHMDVIPFLNLYGHLHELLRNEKYANLSIGHYGHELDPGNPKVNELLTNWIGQYTQLFKSPFIHVGFDETWETKRIADDGDIKISSEKLWLQQLDFVQSELKKYGKTVMTWTDMNNYYPEIIGKIPKDVIPVIWEYKPDTVEINRYLNPVLVEKRKFLIQPAVSGWGHIYPDADYTYTNIDLCLKAGIRNKTLGFINSVWTDPVEPFLRPSWLFMAYGSIGAWQGITADKNKFASDFAALNFPKVADKMKSAFEFLQKSNQNLDKCLGRNTNGMPRGTIIESWSNPFLPYYLSNTEKHLADFKNARKNSEEAQSALISALEKCDKNDAPFINSLLVSARLMHYTATRFLWAKTVCDRWNDSMLKKKKNDFVVYDITYLCHGLLVDMMDENGALKSAYEQAWNSEYKPYRLNTILGRFDVEHALWQKLHLKVNDYRIQNNPDHVATKSFEELFKPDF